VTATDCGRVSLVVRRGRSTAAVQVVCDGRGHPWLWDVVRLVAPRTRAAGRAETWTEALTAAQAAAEQLLQNRRLP
jgi:hypothetical protein